MGVLVVIFVAAFSLDAIDEGPVALVGHLAPALVLLVVVMLAWRWDLVGAIAFAALAIAYAAMNWGNLNWIAAISGPLAAAGLLFLLSWFARKSAG